MPNQLVKIHPVFMGCYLKVILEFFDEMVNVSKTHFISDICHRQAGIPKQLAAFLKPDLYEIING